MAPRARTLGTVAIACVALAAATVAQAPGCNQTAHIALVKALGEGTTRIDRYETETCDDSYTGGHWYANKAPGTAFLTLPWYGILAAIGIPPVTTASLGWPDAMEQMPRSSLWRMTLWGAVLASFLLLLLVRRVGDALVPGYGALAAVTLGLATLVLPFSVLLFSHALSALLGFAAFAALLLERSRPPSDWLVAAAGALAGLAVVVEYPVGIVGVVLAVYAAVRRPYARRLAAYVGGAVVGVAPLFVYNVVAFGSPGVLSYGSSTIGEHTTGFYGVSIPSFRAGVELLLSGKGLLTLTPVAAAGVAGLIVLARRGHRAEALVCAAIAGLFLLYNASYFAPFGGFVPGPRLLVPALPFLAVGLAAAFASRPTVVLALALPSFALMAAATLTNPMIRENSISPWTDALRQGEVTDTVVTLAFGTTGWLAVLPFIVLAGSAAVLAIASVPVPRAQRSELPAVVLVLLIWLVAFDAGPDLLGTDRGAGGFGGLAAAALLMVAACVAVLGALRYGWPAVIAATPLVILAWPGVAGHTWQSAAIVVMAIALVTAASRLSSPAPAPR